jgi:hypothetical protein
MILSTPLLYHQPFLYDIVVTGRSGKVHGNGKTIKGRMANYFLGVNGLPNLLFLHSPSIDVCHISILLVLAEQADFVIQTMWHLDKNGVQAILEVKNQIYHAFRSEINKRSERLTFTTGVKESSSG